MNGPTMTMAIERSPWQRLSERRYFVLIWFGLTFGIGTLQFLYRYLAELAEGNKVPVLVPLINEMTGAVGTGLLFLVLLRFIRRFPLDADGALRRLPLYFVAMVMFGICSTSFMWGSRLVLYYLAGFGVYNYGKMPLRYFMEFPVQVVGFWILVGGTHAMRHYLASKEKEVRTAQIEASLARTQLRNLRLQLQPHFLFNSLNTISATMYEDPQAADEMLDRLAELLRISLKTAQTDEVPLSTELEALDCYLAIMKARFGERLDVEISAEPSTMGLLVPSMVLQPLVENAIRHGNAERSGAGKIRVSTSLDDDHVVLVVDDDGPGTPDDQSIERGVGLSATAERLRLLYDERQSFRVANLDDGGFRVKLEIPRRPAKGAQR